MKLRVRIDGEMFDVEIGELSARPILATVEGQTFEIWPEEAAAPTAPVPAVVLGTPVTAARPSNPASEQVSSANQSKAMLAPIPGVILSLNVVAGDVVAPGQEICVLEAMKMKNVIRANRAGTVAVVRVSTGEQVRHGQVLLEFTD